MAAPTPGPSKEEAQSFTWGGTAARPRRNIERSPLKGETFLKPPGSCQTKWPSTAISVNITACEDCSIYLLDVTSQVQISDCHNCRIVVGPCTGSVFLMDSTNCCAAVAAKQLRLRDCRDCSLHIFAPTSESAVVETSKDLTFGCWQVCEPLALPSPYLPSNPTLPSNPYPYPGKVAYPQLGAQFAAAGWGASSMTNHWAKVPRWLALQPTTHWTRTARYTWSPD